MSVGIHTSNGFVKVAGVGLGATPMAGATENKDGAAGLVPAPAIADRDKYLTGSGIWEEVNLEPAVESAKAYTDEKIGKLEIPTKVSELENDNNYIIEETDPTVPAWAKEANKPTYTASEVGADAEGTATNVVNEHDSLATAHSDIRESVSGLQEKVENCATTMSLNGSTLTLLNESGETLSTITLPASSGSTSETEPENPAEGQVWIA